MIFASTPPGAPPLSALHAVLVGGHRKVTEQLGTDAALAEGVLVDVHDLCLLDLRAPALEVERRQLAGVARVDAKDAGVDFDAGRGAQADGVGGGRATGVASGGAAR